MAIMLTVKAAFLSFSGIFSIFSPFVKLYMRICLCQDQNRIIYKIKCQKNILMKMVNGKYVYVLA